MLRLTKSVVCRGNCLWTSGAIRTQLVRKFSTSDPEDEFGFKGHPLPECTKNHHLRIESQEKYQEFLKSAEFKKKLYWGKLAIFGASFALVPVIGGFNGISAGLAGLAIILLALDKRIGKYLRRLLVSRFVERNMINIDVQNLLHKMVRENKELNRILEGEQIQFYRFNTLESNKDERRFFSRDEVFEVIQKRYDMRSEFIGFKGNVRGTIVARFIYNHPKDFKYEKLLIAISYPDLLTFSYSSSWDELNGDSKAENLTFEDLKHQKKSNPRV